MMRGGAIHPASFLKHFCSIAAAMRGHYLLWLLELLAMHAFEVHINGKKLCVAGIGDDGVLSAIVSWVAKRGTGDLFLQVGGLISPIDEHVSWTGTKRLRVGDKIRVKIVEASSVNRPTRRRRIDKVKELRSKKRYVRMMAKQLGWEVRVHPKRHM
jgi:hypothetical protein